MHSCRAPQGGSTEASRQPADVSALYFVEDRAVQARLFTSYGASAAGLSGTVAMSFICKHFRCLIWLSRSSSHQWQRRF